jgi:hypothetical protein
MSFNKNVLTPFCPMALVVLLALSQPAVAIACGDHTAPKSVAAPTIERAAPMQADHAALLPPQYLAVPEFSACLQAETKGSYTAWCMPAAQPSACAINSWQQLAGLQGSDRVPACSQ